MSRRTKSSEVAPAARRSAVSAISTLALRAAALWLVTGALYKLFLGGPQDLPPLVQDWFGGKATLLLKYRLSIAIELATAVLAFTRPRIGWVLACGALLVFEVVLAPLIASGAESCGCFGSKSPPPTAMALIDGALLALILFGRPWVRTARPIGHPALVLLLLLFVACAPLAVDREARAPAQSPLLATGATDAPGERETGSASAGSAGSERARDYKILSPERWVGKLIYDVEELQGWIDFAPLPVDGTYVFYRRTCTHCAAHLAALAASDDGSLPIVLIRIVETDDSEENRAVHVVPAGSHVMSIELPRGVEYAITTPADFELEGGVVTAAREGIEVE